MEKLKSPHNEKQKCKPTAIYGKSKYRSSQYILNSDKNVFISICDFETLSSLWT